MPAAAAAAPPDPTTQERIVVLRPNAIPEKVALQLRLIPKFVYRYALRGFAADMSDMQAARAEADPRVLFVAEDKGEVVAEVRLPRLRQRRCAFGV